MKSRVITFGVVTTFTILCFLTLPHQSLSWNGETWGDTTRGEIVRRAELMMDLVWSPARGIYNYGYPSEVYHTFNSFSAYTGVAYSQNYPQEDWSEFTSQMAALDFTAGSTIRVSASSLNMRECPGTACGSVAVLPQGGVGEVLSHVDNGIVPSGSSFHWYYVEFSSQTGWCAAYSSSSDYLILDDTSGYSPGIGNDCSGFATICWTLGSRYTTTTFESDAAGAGGSVDSLGNIGTCQTADLIKGDACVKGGSHIILFNRTIDSGNMESMEQTPWNAYRRTWAWSSLGDYRPIRRRQLTTSPTPTPIPTAAPPTTTPPPAVTPTPPVGGIMEGFDSFDGSVRPDGWNFTNCNSDSDVYTSSGNYGSSSPSLKIDDTGDQVTTRFFDPDADFVLTFWLKGVSVEPTSHLLVEEYSGGWTTVTDLYGISTSGLILGPFDLANPTRRVRFSYTKNGGNLALDDVRIDDPASPTPSQATPTAPPTAPPTASPTAPPTAPPTGTPTPTACVSTPTPMPTSEVPTPTAQPTPPPTPDLLIVDHDDYDGDGLSDIGIWRSSNGGWYINGVGTTFYGKAGDVPVPGDYDGDGTADTGIFRPGTGKWYFPSAAGVYWGRTGDIPVPADYDGDATSDVAVWRESLGKWYVNGQFTVYYGKEGDVPVPGDYDGDGDADLAIYRPALEDPRFSGGSRWYIRGISNVFFGRAGDSPVPGDYNGDGTTQIAVFRSGYNRWYLDDGSFVTFGQPGDVPLAYDYDGDGTADRTIFRPATSTWVIYQKTTLNWGRDGDSAVSGAMH